MGQTFEKVAWHESSATFLKVIWGLSKTSFFFFFNAFFPCCFQDNHLCHFDAKWAPRLATVNISSTLQHFISYSLIHFFSKRQKSQNTHSNELLIQSDCWCHHTSNTCVANKRMYPTLQNCPLPALNKRRVRLVYLHGCYIARDKKRWQLRLMCWWPLKQTPSDYRSLKDQL